jgi:hypothetical protein
MTDHLRPEIRSQVDLPPTERAVLFRAPRWIGYDAAVEHLAAMTDRCRLPPHDRMRGFTVIGPFNNGKTMLVERFRQIMNAQQRSNRVYSIDVPGAPSLMRFLAALRRTFQAPSRSGSTLADREDQILTLLSNLKPAAIVLDEFHNVLDAAPRERKMIFAFLRAWGKLHVAPILVGDTRLRIAIDLDEQMESRLDLLGLERWAFDESFLTLLDSLEAVLPLRHPSDLSGEELASLLYERTEGLIGRTTEVCGQAATLAMEEGVERITRAHVERVAPQPPSLRRSRDLSRLV